MLILLPWMLLLSMSSAQFTHTATETHTFSIPVSPNMFNWTYQEFDQQYRFHASLDGRPELPSWLRYIYSGRHHAGFVFGTPPRGVKSPITLEVIGLNRQDYVTRRIEIKLIIEAQKTEDMARNQLQLKIDNLNVEDLLDQHRMDHLMEIFTTKLWPNSQGHLYPTFLASAIDMGARLPLRPNEGEGLVVRLGSSKLFSGELRRLREEVQPLSRLSSCPREFKRTTVERVFRLAAFTLDWCSFKLYEVSYTEESSELTEILDDPQSKGTETAEANQSDEVYSAYLPGPLRREVVPRSYTRELLASVLFPLLLMLLPASALTVSLCCHYVGVSQKTAKVEMCRYSDQREGNGSNNRSYNAESARPSPNNSLVRPYSPKSSRNLAGSYNRPQPPPYLGSSNNILRKSSPSTASQSPEHNRTLEESLKLLNNAKIGTDNDFSPVTALGDVLRKSKSGIDIDLRQNYKMTMDNLRAQIIDPDVLHKSTPTINNAYMKDEVITPDNDTNAQTMDRMDGMDNYMSIKRDGYVTMKPDAGYVLVKSEFGFGNGNALAGKPAI